MTLSVLISVHIFFQAKVSTHAETMFTDECSWKDKKLAQHKREAEFYFHSLFLRLNAKMKKNCAVKGFQFIYLWN